MRRFCSNADVLVEPFCGGAIVGLTALMENLAKRVVLCEMDPGVAAVWQVLCEGEGEALSDLILNYEMQIDQVRRDLKSSPRSNLRRAFQTILRNRVQRGGIMAPGASLMKSGENGKGIRSRWYPETLARRIRAIHQSRSRLDFRQSDAFEVIGDWICKNGTVFFIDPPYTAGGKRAGRRLYSHNTVDHARLFREFAQTEAPFLMTYDESPEVETLAKKYGFAISRVPMKNTHHNCIWEYVITRQDQVLPE